MAANAWEGLVYVLMVVGVVASASTAVLARRHGNGDDPSTRALFWIAAFASFWGTCTLAEELAPTHELHLLVSKLTYLGISGTVAAVFVFALVYSGREKYVTRRTLALLAVEPVLVNVLVWTTEHHGLVYQVADDGTVLVGEYGPFFPVHAVYGYVLIVGSVALLLGVVRRQQSLFQRQSLAVGFAALAPLPANAVYLAGFAPLDLTPAAFSASGLALLWAVVRADLTALSPVARDRIVHEMDAGALVLNADGVVVDVNPEMKRVLGLDPDRDVVGEPIDALLANYGEIRERFREGILGDGEVTIETGDGVAHYTVEVSPLYDHRDRERGHMFLVHDITDQKRRQRELQRKNEQLDEFASLVSHDLRNPLNVADGVLDLAEATSDPGHFEEVREMHDRMDRLIDDLLTLAREGETVDETESVDLDRVAREAWDNVDTGEATLSSDCRGYVFEADRSRLLQVFENLFRNALEHGVPADGDRDGLGVSVGPIRPDDGSVDPFDAGFYVEDDGAGMPPEIRDSAFEHGYTTDENGTGLGLSIVDQVVRAHGWEVRAGAADSGGARFEVRGVASLEERRGVPEPQSE